METSAAGTAQDNRGRNSVQVLMLVAGWGAWSLWAVAYVGYLLVAVIPFSGNLVYCVAEDGSPSGSKVVNRPGFVGGSGYLIPTPVGEACWAA